jgi:hypothetical protein
MCEFLVSKQEARPYFTPLQHCYGVIASVCASNFFVAIQHFRGMVASVCFLAQEKLSCSDCLVLLDCLSLTLPCGP